MFAKMSKVAHWLQRRSPQYIVQRFFKLIRRYGWTTAKARNRVVDCILQLRRYGCAPSFPTPGRVVEQNPDFCRALQQLGAELAVHGYDHVDFHSLTLEESRWQFERALQAYQQAGVTAAGFRCPYLSYSDRLLDALPTRTLRYSSNTAVVWEHAAEGTEHHTTPIFASLSEFYAGVRSDQALTVPHIGRTGLVEVPVSVPDDMQIYDGLRVGRKGLALAWLNMLQQSYQRGEMLTLLFHPELYYLCDLAFERLLIETRSLRPAIWVARLCDIADWWNEKASFAIHLTPNARGMTLDFQCSERATILARHLDLNGRAAPWRGAYQQIHDRQVQLPAAPLPLLGVTADVPAATITLLREQGYLLLEGEQAVKCATCIDGALVARLPSPVALIAYIEQIQTPLIRYWRWPHGYASVLSFSGDLDALSLWDYAARLFNRAGA